MECETEEEINRANLEYAWFRDGLLLNETSSNVTFSSNRVRFNKLDHNIDDGVYQCQIEIEQTGQKLTSPELTIQVERN